MQQTLQHSAVLTHRGSRSKPSGAQMPRFPRRLLGVDARSVQRFVAANEERIKTLADVFDRERSTLERRLDDANAEIERLRRDLHLAEQCAAAYREQESMIARTLLVAEKTAEDLVRTSRVDAAAVVGQAEAIAGDIVQTACRSASETLQKAQGDAEAVVAAAKEQATAWLGMLLTETDRLVNDAQGRFREAHRSTVASVTSLLSRLELRATDWGAAWRDGTPDQVPQRAGMAADWELTHTPPA
jgi:cell division septum initiation protein DivIVA